MEVLDRLVSVDERASVLPESPRLRWLILGVLALMAAVSTTVGIREALVHGIDFQWSAARMLGQHIDPWKTYLGGDPEHRIILGQQPNYLAEMYLLLLPLGKLPFAVACAWWCGLNLLFLASTLWMLGKMFGLDRDHLLLLTLCTLSSTPFRVTLSNGQHGLFVVAMLTLAFYASSRAVSGLALGLSYGKYSFAPILVLLLLLKRRFAMVAISLLVPIAGVLIAWRMLGGNLVTLAFEPMATSKVAESPGTGDLMSLVKLALWHFGVFGGPAFTIPSVVSVVAGVVAAVWLWRSRALDERMQYAVGLVLTLACFVHLLYDYVALAVPLAAALVSVRTRARDVVFGCMVGLWLMSSAINKFIQPMQVTIPIYFVLLVVLALATARLKLRVPRVT